ncbi:diguanylate cyclase domain-containing protein [Microvirga tunisiensis]|uniref:Diguanylate cyclase n=1 Tax=Microvirga tunisiensis TaxID=2108360 RepID=A0A5N7MT43_9HYPH|nr:diguanylate cyclase [Microvirga tunisiensis]MPR30171.1 diguanylate cyclase [Microvirga tunisiensis]
MVPLSGEDAGRPAGQIRHSFESVAKIVLGQRVRVTVSVGCATGTTSTVKGLLRHADTALYGAKAQGRNVVVSASSRSPVPCRGPPDRWFGREPRHHSSLSKP